MTPVESALNELKQALVEFINLLERELLALQLGQTEELSTVVTEKTAWSTIASTAWNRLVVASGINTRRGESLDGKLSAHPNLRGPWREIRSLAEKAERLNQGNNALIEAQLQRTRMALDVLQSASNRGSIYGANGRYVDSFKSGHTFDKA